jgi:hypothetical protein
MYDPNTGERITQQAPRYDPNTGKLLNPQEGEPAFINGRQNPNFKFAPTDRHDECDHSVGVYNGRCANCGLEAHRFVAADDKTPEPPEPEPELTLVGRNVATAYSTQQASESHPPTGG